jgi:hypothetical protein
MRSGSLIPALAVAVAFSATGRSQANDVLLREDFEQRQPSEFYTQLVDHDRLELRRNAGVGRGNALRADYVGSDDGSERIIVTQPLAQTATESTLCFDVQFEEGFKFVQGGRLHGIGPDNRAIGQRPEDPDAWCARIRFRADGTLETSTSHQDQRADTGDKGRRVRAYRLLPGRYYAVSLHVKLNDPDASNGFTKLYVNGVLVEERTDVRFRKVADKSSEISHIMFNTFYGGTSRQDAPRNPDGSYAVCRALFDNMTVYTGEHIRKAPGERPWRRPPACGGEFSDWIFDERI